MSPACKSSRLRTIRRNSWMKCRQQLGHDSFLPGQMQGKLSASPVTTLQAAQGMMGPILQGLEDQGIGGLSDGMQQLIPVLSKRGSLKTFACGFKQSHLESNCQGQNLPACEWEPGLQQCAAGNVQQRAAADGVHSSFSFSASAADAEAGRVYLSLEASSASLILPLARNVPGLGPSGRGNILQAAGSAWQALPAGVMPAPRAPPTGMVFNAEVSGANLDQWSSDPVSSDSGCRWQESRFRTILAAKACGLIQSR